MVPVIALLELLGGLALLLGLEIRIFSVLLVLDMIAAIFTAKLSMGLVGGYEFELIILAGLLSLLFSGPGAFSLRKRDA